MKIKLKNLNPNPYRDMNNYPIDPIKVQSLVDSIEKTGFWDNILARNQKGDIQIAYGHHRLEALRKVMKPDDEVDIPVKELSDALMIKIMANENMEDWRVLPKVIDETVRVAKQFLETHPDEVNNLGCSMEQAKVQGIGRQVISRFLSWPESRVSSSLERLRLITENKIDQEAINKLPTERAARDFVTAVKRTELPIEKQKQAVERILETTRGEKAVMDAVIEEKWQMPKKKVQEYIEPRTIKYDNYIAEIRDTVNNLNQKLLEFIALENEIGLIKSSNRALLHMSLNPLKIQIEKILNNYKNEKTIN